MAQTPARPEEKGPKTPAWIVSFTDMITLLLAFFVLLLAFANEQDPELFEIGRGAFRREIAGLGIPDLLFGRRQTFQGQFMQRRHPTEEAETEKEQERIIDLEDGEIRRVFAELKQMMGTRTTEKTPAPSNVISTPVRFEPGSVSLDAPGREHLRGLAVNLGQNLRKKGIRIYVIGSAADQPPGKDRWILSARRAEAVSRFLQEALPAGPDRPSLRLIPLGSGLSRSQRQRSDEATGQEFIRIAIVGAQ